MDSCQFCFAWNPHTQHCRVKRRTTKADFHCPEFWRDTSRNKTDLFDAAKAREAKRDGVARVDRNAAEGWREIMFEIVREVAARQRLFTSDDVFEIAHQRGVANGTHDLRAFGPVMMKASKRLLCRKANVPAENSRRASLHASPRQVWESLLV